MNNRMRTQMALLSLAGIAFAGCSTSSTEPQTGSTVELFADYPVYDSATIVQESAIIVEGNVVSTEPTVLTPRYEGDSPEENPLVGLTEEEKAKAISQNGGVAGTLFHFHVNKVHKGAVNAGDEIVIVQTGGTQDDVLYVVEGTTVLQADTDYLLFAAESFDGAYAILGGSAGTYYANDDNDFVAAAPESAPFKVLTELEN